MLTRRAFLDTSGAIALTAACGAGRAMAETPGIVTPPMLVASLQRAVDAGTPGLSAAIATKRGVVWTGVAGLADVQSGRPVDEATIFGIGSITKLFVTVVILQLVQEKRLSLDATLLALLGQGAMRGIANAATATVGQLLAHTAGVPSWEDDPAWIHKGRGDGLDPAHHWSKTEALDFIRDTTALNPPGMAFSYSNSGFTILGLIIERVTGHTAESEIHRRIILPLGLGSTYLEGFEPPQAGRLPHRYHYATPVFRATAGIAPGFPTVRPELSPALIDASSSNLSVEWTAGGMISSPVDLVRLAGALRDGELLSAESLAYMQAWRPARPNTPIGHGLFRFGTPAGALLGHNGSVLGFTGSLWWAEKGDAIVAVLANVGSMHAGKIPPAAYDVALNSDFTALALDYARQHGESAR